MTMMSIGAFIMLVALTIFVWFSIVRMMRDLNMLSSALDEVVAKENYTVRLPDHQRTDELSHAFVLFNRLLEYTDRLLREKEALASIDSLTGLMNRRSLLKYAQRELSRAGRYGQPLSLIFLDIDHFKQVNDTQGHLIGDEVLEIFARVIKARARDTDIVSRWGGEEFLILAPQSDLEGARVLAEDLRKAVACESFPTHEQLTCSLGVAQWRKNESFEALCARADAALYMAKETGRNRVQVDEQTLIEHQE
ncbi:MAG: GGDEF domain-containing protein [Rhodocyclaceae bacterium]|nr:GGDEF domain-containing protein [Rhodocyclaceae bacterium]